ncbi:MAG: hypothetical protein K5Q68_15140 [Roseococcus sp.]|nr:hypothetical protein [Roseococcus sp.]
MKNLIALALFASLPSLAQAQTVWTSPNLSISGNRSNGCDLRIVEVTHNGSPLSSLRFVVLNRGSTAVIVNADVTMTGNNQRKTGPIFGVIAAGQQGTLQGFHPFGGSLAGSTVAIRFTSCAAR